MASLLLKGVHKRLGLPSVSSISCSSADATSIIASTGTTTGSSGRAIDRHSPRLQDPHRSTTSKPPRPSTSNSTKDSASSDDLKQQQHAHGSKKKKKKKKGITAGAAANGSRSSEKRLVSPATSSRFLLNSSRLQSGDLDVLALPPPPPQPFIDVFPGGQGKPPSFIDAFPGHASLHLPFAKEAPSPVQQAESSSSSSSGTTSSSSASSSSEITAVQEEQQKTAVVTRSSTTTRARTQEGQVVVLRVSLNCKGCAGKVKKHIAKMEGVTSYSYDIDIPSKKVTVVGDVTPLGVLTSVSKVKPAQFWPLPPRPPCVSASF